MPHRVVGSWLCHDNILQMLHVECAQHLDGCMYVCTIDGCLRSMGSGLCVCCCAGLPFCIGQTVSTYSFPATGYVAGFFPSGVTWSYSSSCANWDKPNINPITRLCLRTGPAGSYMGGITIQYLSGCTQTWGSPTNCLDVAVGDYVSYIEVGQAVPVPWVQ
jgi:hypothetical protein